MSPKKLNKLFTIFFILTIVGSMYSIYRRDLYPIIIFTLIISLLLYIKYINTQLETELFAESRWLISRSIMELHLLDRGGIRAEYKKTYHMRSLLKEGDVEIFTFLRVDGEVESLDYIEGEGYLPEFTPLSLEIDSGKGIKLNYPDVIRGKEFIGTFDAILKECFRNTTEFWTEHITHPIGSLYMKIRFPEGVTPRNIKGEFFTEPQEKYSFETYYRTGHKPRVVEKDGAIFIEWRVNNPRLGFFYRVTWDW